MVSDGRVAAEETLNDRKSLVVTSAMLAALLLPSDWSVKRGLPT